ncbi:MAG TPA: N-acetylneuraminate synthase family protein [Spirochaetota bacterium]|nr:N-acetylneuraminate synthase family protein [Spirochaetota bacterium]
MLESIFKHKKTIFIAEIGLNHNGSFAQAYEMIMRAADAGADAVKFQTFDPELMNSPYTRSLLEKGDTSFTDRGVIDFLSKFTLEKDEYLKLKERATASGVEFFSAPFDAVSVDLLEYTGVKLYKVASSEVTNIPLLRRIALTRKPVIMSTGMSSEDEIAAAVKTLKDGGCPEICLLHCVSLYPMRSDEANLLRIVNLRERFGLHTGLSDHSTGHETVSAAAILGARVFEKHFRLGEDHECPDAAVSLTPAAFKEMVEKVNEAISMLGSGDIAYSGRESDTARGAKRSIFAATDIGRGEVFDEKSLVLLRPGTGISASMFYSVTGKKALRDIPAGAPVKPEDFE